MMTKLIYSTSFDKTVDVGVRIVEDRAQLTKSANTIFGCDYASLAPDKDHVGIHLTALGAYERYGCFFEGAPVATLTGQVPIESVQVGDKVLTHAGNYKPVTAVFETDYTGDRVTLNIGGLPDPIVSTANHPFTVVRRAGLSPATRWALRAAGTLSATLEARVSDAGWVSADSVKPGDYVAVPVELSDTVKAELGPIPNAYDPYVCGFYLAEGCLTKEYRDIVSKDKYKGVMITCSKHDAASLDRCDAWLASIGREPVVRGASYTSELGVRYCFGFTEFAMWLDATFGHRAVSKRLGPQVWCWSHAQRIEFIAGYFDGDGCMTYGDSRYTGTLTASTASRTLALDMQRLLASVGIPSSVNKGWNKSSNGCFGTKDNVIYSLSVGAYYSNIITAKSCRFKPHTRIFTQHGAACMQLAYSYALLPVLSVAVDFIEDAIKYNIEVADDNSYIVDIQGHNSNRNSDAFEKAACVKYHDTFVKHGHVFRHHRNRPNKGDQILGDVKASAYNDAMDRIELFVHAHKEKCTDELARIEKEGEIAHSMACTVPGDWCSICNQFRKNAEDPNECDHIKWELGKMQPDGKVACMLNRDPTFFDISFVGRPADRIAWNLKVASGCIESSVKLAEEAGLWVPDTVAIISPVALRKLDLMKKIATLQDCYIGWGSGQRNVKTASDRYFYELRKAAGCSLGDAAIERLRRCDPADAFHSLASAGVVMNVTDFFKYAMGPEYHQVEEYMDKVKCAVPGVISEAVKQAECQRICNDSAFDVLLDRPPRPFEITFSCKLAEASFIGQSKEERVIAATLDQKVVKIAIDNEPKLWLNTPVTVVLAEKYAAYELSAVDAMLSLRCDTDTDSVLALVAAQNLIQ